jgi:hypothetical protein
LGDGGAIARIRVLTRLGNGTKFLANEKAPKATVSDCPTEKGLIEKGPTEKGLFDAGLRISM